MQASRRRKILVQGFDVANYTVIELVEFREWLEKPEEIYTAGDNKHNDKTYKTSEKTQNNAKVKGGVTIYHNTKKNGGNTQKIVQKLLTRYGSCMVLAMIWQNTRLFQTKLRLKKASKRPQVSDKNLSTKATTRSFSLRKLIL